jgi:hypothetical protein
MKSEKYFAGTKERDDSTACADARSQGSRRQEPSRSIQVGGVEGEEHDLQDNRQPPVILRLDRVDATSANAARVREQVRSLNARLAMAGVPLQLRVIGSR